MKGGCGLPRPLTLALTFWLTQTSLAIEVELNTAEVDQDGCITQVVLVEEESDKTIFTTPYSETLKTLGVNFWITFPPLQW